MRARSRVGSAGRLPSRVLAEKACRTVELIVQTRVAVSPGAQRCVASVLCCPAWPPTSLKYLFESPSRIEGWQRSRHELPPGMTGLWQVFGSARIPLQEMVKIDYLYGANWSLWLDVKILMRTVSFVLERRGL